jgi:TonB-dependent starch-binding outer membrane protein SusC
MLVKTTAFRLWTILCLSFITSFAFSQQRTVTGRVTDSNNQPVVGASVVIKGTTTGTTTDQQGRFSLSVPSDQTVLSVSYVGHEARDITVGNASNLDVALTSNTSTLNEVIVTGYSSQRRKDITGSVSVVKVEDLKSVPAANAEQQLQGRAAGVTVTTSGVPGAAANVRIRGFSNFGENSPLYIVDGVPTGGLGGLNPNDIETMQVLKDAAAASIYGARAATGVIIVTTKKGRQGTAKVAYNTYYGRQDPGKGFTNLLNPQEMADLTFLAYRNAGQATPTTQYGTGSNPVLPDYILPAGKMAGDPAVDPSKYSLNLNDVNAAYLIVRANKAGTNWYDEITNNAPIMNHNIAVSGGANKSRYVFSFDYFDQKGIVIYNYYKRYTARVNTEFSIKDNIRIGENLQLSYNEDNTPGNNNEGTEIAMAYRNQPIIPVYDIMGNFAGSRAPNLGNASNPFATRTRSKDNSGQNMGLFGNMYAEVDFLRNFTARTSFGGQMSSGNYYYFNFITYENSENNTGNSFTEGFNRFRSWTWTNQLTYKNIIAEEHNIQALIGTEAIEEWGRSIEGTRVGYFLQDPDFRSLNNGGAAGQRANGGPYTPSSLLSYFGKVDYAFRDRYLASVTVRRDGSSRFGPENRWGTFPAASVGWRISQEPFMQSVTWLTDAKLRASWGVMGGQRINPGNAFTQFNQGPGSSYYDINGTGNSVVPGFQVNFVGNPAGKWEKNTTKDLGFDATLFNGKTEVAFDYYQKETSDLLFQRAGVATGGVAFAQPRTFYNTANMKNSGVDLMLTQRSKFGGSRGIGLDATFTFTTYNNKITGLAEGVDFYESGGSRIGNFVRNAIGHPVSSFYGYEVVGLFQSQQDVDNSPVQAGAGPGRFKYLDADRNDTINDKDRVFFGDPNPDFTYGLNLNASFMNFDVSVFFYGAKGAQAINYVRWWTDFFPSFQGGKSEDLLYNSWSEKNPNARTPIAENISNFSNNTVPNSYYLENASYLRLKNLTIGYTLPSNLLGRLGIDKFRIYVQGANLFTITKYTGLDPEIIGGQDNFGIDAGAYPTVKQYLIGANLNF